MLFVFCYYIYLKGMSLSELLFGSLPRARTGGVNDELAAQIEALTASERPGREHQRIPWQ